MYIQRETAFYDILHILAVILFYSYIIFIIAVKHLFVSHCHLLLAMWF